MKPMTQAQLRAAAEWTPGAHGDSSVLRWRVGGVIALVNHEEGGATLTMRMNGRWVEPTQGFTSVEAAQEWVEAVVQAAPGLFR